MSRIRTIKPDFWRHEDLSELPEATHMLAAALLNYADDEGYFNANPKLIKAECCPLREPSVSIPDSLNMLSRIGFIRLGTGEDGKRYGHVVNFESHQRVNRKTESKIKTIRIEWEGSPPPHGGLSESSPPEGKGREREQGREYTEPNGSSADAPGEIVPMDVRAILFGEGLSSLRRMSGRTDAQCRRLLGKWLKTADDDASAVLATIRRAVETRPAEPVPWIEASLKPRDPDEAIYRGVL